MPVNHHIMKTECPIDKKQVTLTRELLCFHEMPKNNFDQGPVLPGFVKTSHICPYNFLQNK